MSLLPVGEITIPSRALDHRHVREARAIAEVFSVDKARLQKVIGTDNRRRAEPIVQLYGWGSNVSRHRDKTGFVYFTPLTLRYSRVFTERTSYRLHRGMVYRLHDFAWHWTRDSAPVVCMFIGPYQFPCDTAARLMLQVGADALALGGRDAPRVSPGFRVPLKGEVYAWNVDDGADLVTLAEARAKNWLIARCALCDRFAVKLDKQFPSHSDMNRCLIHFGEVERVEEPAREAA